MKDTFEQTEWNMKSFISKLSAIVLLLNLATNFSVAADNNEKDSKQKYQCQLISRSEAIKQAKSRLNGKVVGVQLSERDDRSVYRVRILIDNKRIKTISIQACR